MPLNQTTSAEIKASHNSQVFFINRLYPDPGLSMEIQIRESNNVSILDVVGEIDIFNSPDLKNAVSQLIARRRNNILINLDRVAYIDSSGIGALVACLSGVRKEEGQFKLVNVHGVVKRVFELTKLRSFFTICESEEEALSSFD